MLQHILRNTVPLVDCVAHISHVLYTHLRSIESAGCEVAHEVKEGYALRHFGFGFFGPGDLVHDLYLLRRRTIFEGFVEMRETLQIEPAQTAAHGDLVFGHIFYNELDEGRYAGLRSAAADLVFGDDDIAQDRDRRDFIGREKSFGPDLLFPFYLFLHPVDMTAGVFGGSLFGGSCRSRFVLCGMTAFDE